MTTKKCAAVILATEENIQMKSAKSRFMMYLLSEPIIGWVVKAIKNSGIDDISVVVSDNDRTVTPFVKAAGCEVCIKQKSFVTSKEFIRAHEGSDVLIIRGDTPLMDASTIRAAYIEHQRSGNKATIISASAEMPFGYSRVVRDENGNFVSVVEERMAASEIKKIKEVASGTYWFNSDALIKGITECEKQENHNIEAVIDKIIEDGSSVGTFSADSSDVILKADDRKQLRQLNETARVNEIYKHLEAGVDIPCIDSIMIEPGVEIGIDTLVLPGTILRGKVKIGKNCRIGPNVVIENSEIGDNVILDETECYESIVKNGCNIGPYVHIRPNSVVGENVHLGNFVEVKNSTIDVGTKVSHLTYVGDSDVGKRVNFGCGTVTVNYTGKSKFRTTIKDDAFIGCNTNLVAPVTVGRGAYTAAGSTITEDVPEDSLAIARARQVNKNGWCIRARVKGILK